jgi:uncharacterized alpha-E superfamily protein
LEIAMLLSSSAETLFWFARYLERAEGLSRAVLTYEELGLDLPGSSAPNATRLLAALGLEAKEASPAPLSERLSAQILDRDNPSSVLGALRRARENLRVSRVLLPTRCWEALNTACLELDGLQGQASTAELLSALVRVEGLCHELAGNIAAGLTRDDAHAFLDVGRHLERADMVLRLVTVLSALVYPDQLRPFEDVRWIGLLKSVAAFEMYRRCHRGRVDVVSALDFLLFARNFPRSVTYCLDRIDAELASLPRADIPRAALSACRLDAPRVLAQRSASAIVSHAHQALGTLGALNAAVSSTYFSRTPELEAVAS